MKKYILLFLLFVTGSIQTFAQCPMCRSAVESSMRSGSGKSVGMGLNSGILMLLAVVYLVIFSTAIIWYLKYRKSQRNAPAN